MASPADAPAPLAPLLRLLARARANARPAEQTRHLAFLFTDIEDSSGLHCRLGDEAAAGWIRAHFDWLDDLMRRFGGVVIKTMGDGAMAAFGDPAAAVAAALAVQEESQTARGRIGGPRLALRVGVHAGPCIVVRAGTSFDCFGTTVNLAARLLRASKGGDVVVSRAVAGDAGVSALLRRHLNRPAEMPIGDEGSVMQILCVEALPQPALAG